MADTRNDEAETTVLTLNSCYRSDEW